ncbi:MAG: chromate transporter [Eubacteriales bacterium]|nr:chromate transporter [Eubacteriales bacterium]
MIYLKLFLTFFKIGAFTFGGGYAMIPLIQQEVLTNEWLSGEELIDVIAISESTPGPLAVNASTFVGMQTAGVFGAFCATLGVVLPSFIIILIVARVFDKFQKSKVVNGAMLGLKGAVVGLIGAAVLTTGVTIFGSAIHNGRELFAIIFLLAGLAFGLKKKMNPILLIVISAVVGIIVKPLL